MRHIYRFSFSDDVHSCGQAAVQGLGLLIEDALRCSDVERASALNGILRNVEIFLQLARQLPGDHVSDSTPSGAVHERQAAFIAPVDDIFEVRGAATDMNDGPGRQDFEALTPREKDIVRHLAQGSPNKVVARNLDIAEATVKVHIKAVLRKLHLKNRTQIALSAVQQRWLHAPQADNAEN